MQIHSSAYQDFCWAPFLLGDGDIYIYIRNYTFSCGTITFGMGGQPKVDVDVHLRLGDVFQIFFIFTPTLGRFPHIFQMG